METYWLWYWGVNQDNKNEHSEKKKFTDFDKMKSYSSKHSYEHRWIGKNYWSNYEQYKKEEKE